MGTVAKIANKMKKWRIFWLARLIFFLEEVSTVDSQQSTDN
jgi:hypothetical protein